MSKLLLTIQHWVTEKAGNEVLFNWICIVSKYSKKVPTKDKEIGNGTYFSLIMLAE